jgi:hypothetical protein
MASFVGSSHADKETFARDAMRESPRSIFSIRPRSVRVLDGRFTGFERSGNAIVLRRNDDVAVDPGIIRRRCGDRRQGHRLHAGMHTPCNPGSSEKGQKDFELHPGFLGDL